MQANGLEKLIGIAATVTRAIQAPPGQRVSATHVALLASRLYEAIKAERDALDPADARTRALLDHALNDCERLACAGDRLMARLEAVSALLADGIAHPRCAHPKRARAPRRTAPTPPPPRLRLFRLIEGGRST